MVNRKWIGFVVVVLALIGCKGSPGFKWPEAVQCAGNVGDLVGTVTQILVSDLGGSGISPEGQQKLRQLAEQYGAASVLCIVQTLVKDWSAPAASPSPERMQATARARDFLAKTGTVVQ